MSLSIILTCYNEVPLIFDSYQKIVDMMNSSQIEYEMVIVDDGSQSKVQEQLREYFQTKENTVLSLSEINEGRGAAVAKGIKASSKKYAGFIDTDLEISETYILNLYYAINKALADVAIGKREYARSFNVKHIVRDFLSRIYFLFVNAILKLKFLDTETGIKIFNRKKILTILDSVQDKKWFWDTEIISESVRSNFKIIQEPVYVRRNENKTSQVKVFRDAYRYLSSLYKYCRRHQRKGFGRIE